MPRGRPRQDQVNVSNDNNNIPKTINFNYSENFNRVTELSVENFTEWKTNILYLLCINNLDSYVTTEKIKKVRKRDITDDISQYIQDKFNDSLVYDISTTENDIKNDITVKWIIINSLGDTTKKLIQSHSKTSYQIWKMLNKAYTKSPEQRRVDLKDLIDGMKYNIDEDIHIFIAVLQNYIDELENIEGDLSANTKIGILNRSLPENLRWINVFQFKNNWERCVEYVKNVIPEIIFSNTKESTNTRTNQLFNIINHKVLNKNKNKNILSTHFRKRKNLHFTNKKCRICNKYGHNSNECWFNPKNKFKNRNKPRIIRNAKSQNSTNKRTTTTKFKNRHFSKNNNSEKNTKNIFTIDSQNAKSDKYPDFYPDNFVDDYTSKTNTEINYLSNNPSHEINSTTINDQKMTCWILDSGASIHTTNDISLLYNITPCNEEISLADNKTVNSKYKGDFSGSLNDNDFCLSNVYFVPDISKNLISINSLINCNYKVVFTNINNASYSIIYNPSGRRICSTAVGNSNIYKIWTTTKYCNTSLPPPPNVNHISNNENLQLWHRRLCHFNINKIKQILPRITSSTKCPVCSHSKLRNKPYYLSSSETSSILEKIHMDLIGPIQESVHGNKYILTILDDYSRYGWTLFLQNKSDTFNTFHNWYLKIKNLLNLSIKYIKSDNGTEFTNYHFNNFCDFNGITHLFSIPHNPQQNGKIERFNETLITASKSILNESKLHYKFWEDAVSTVCHIYNRLPHSGNHNNIPYEIIFRSPVKYDNLRVFGCKVFYYLPKSFRNKFENNAVPGVFLGYSENGYKILDTQNNKTIYSRTVDFFENDLDHALNNPNSQNFSNKVPKSGNAFENKDKEGRPKEKDLF